jgi:hypothetical protein
MEQHRHGLDEEPTLASRNPALRNYGIFLVVAATAGIFVNHGYAPFEVVVKSLIMALILDAILGALLLTGIILLRAHDKESTLKGLRTILIVTVLLGIGIVLLPINSPVILIAIFAALAVQRAKTLVGRTA